MQREIGFAAKCPTGVAVPLPSISEIVTAPNVLAFLDYLEKQRHNKPRSRNARLSALRAFAGYLLAFDPLAQTPQLQRILAIPAKRWARPLVGFLSETEVRAVLQAPSPTGWTGRRNRLLFQLLYNTGARVSEIIHLRVADVIQDQCQTIRFTGKGRKQRILPVGKSTRRLLQAWLKENALKLLDIPKAKNLRFQPTDLLHFLDSL